MRARFLLSHHLPEHEHRCVKIAGRPVCARCLGMYPSLLLGLILLFSLDGFGVEPMHARPMEGALLVLLVSPALLDWIRGRISPKSGSNVLRLVTGFLLGLGLARIIHLQAIAPFQQPALDLIILLALGVGVGEIMARALGGSETRPTATDRMDPIDPKGSSDVTSDREPGEEAG